MGSDRRRWMGWVCLTLVGLSAPWGCQKSADENAGYAPVTTNLRIDEMRLRQISTGDLFDAVGRRIESDSSRGSLMETPLSPLPGYNQFWFAWSVFNHESELFRRDRNNRSGALVGDDECAVPCDEIQQGCPGKDCIPALTNPKFVSPSDSEADYLRPNSFVVGVAVNGEAHAYPHNILWWHEIVNDTVGGQNISVTHCPLTFSSLGHDRDAFIEGETVDLGVSGQLFNSNLVFYNRSDDSYFSQLLGSGTVGDALGQPAPRVHVWEMTWEAWLQLFPDTEVLSSNTGHARDYERYPYGDYFTDDDDTFASTSPRPDDTFANKDFTYGLRIGDSSKAYVHRELQQWAKETYEGDDQQGLLRDKVGDQEVLIAFDLDGVYVQAFAVDDADDWELTR